MAFVRPRPLRVCLALVLALPACRDESPPEPGLHMAVDDTAIRGTYSRAGAVVRFDATQLAGAEVARLTLDVDGKPLELTLDLSAQRFIEDAHGSTFTLADRELLVGLRDAIGEAHPEVIDTLAGSLLVRAADRYAEVPVGRARSRLDISIGGAVGPAKADLVQSGCGDDGTNCFPGTYGQAWAVFEVGGGVCRAESAYYGDNVCRGRCGAGCSWWDEDYTWDCFDHDVCLDYSSACDSEWDDATDDWAVTWGYWCTSGSSRPKPPPVQVCGNSNLEAGETCDDGNTASCDGCSATCQLEPPPAPGVKVYDHCDARDSLAFGDWRPWSYKAQCAIGAPMTGWSKATHPGNGGAAHAALCRPAAATEYPQDTCRTLVFAAGDDRGTTETGDWDPFHYKGECTPGEYVAGISQRAADRVSDAILCCRGVELGHSSCTAHVFHGGNSGWTPASGDWDVGYWKGECAEGFYAAGVSTIPATGAPHALLCCQ